MGIVRTAIPSSLSVPGLKVDLYGTATAYPCGISKDRKTLYGASSILEATAGNAILYQSTDDGTTWSSVHTFTGEIVVGIRETDDGEALAYTQNTTSSPGYVYKSSGWSASHTTATWSKVLTTTGGYIRPRWGGGHTWSFGDDSIRAGSNAVGIINEYGGQTTGSGDQTVKATRAYLTTNYGATWTQVLDLQVRYPGVLNLHLHCTAYDPYWDRLWATFGDVTVPEGTNNKTFVAYSDDRGATWTLMDRPTNLQVTGNSGGANVQATAIGIFRDSIVLVGDNAPGLFRIPRKGYRVIGSIEVGGVVAANTASQIIGMPFHQNPGQPTAPMFAGFTAPSTEAHSSMLVSVDNGLTWHELWFDSALQGDGNKGVHTVYGPTYNGKVVASVAQSASVTWLLRGELIVPEPSLRDAVLTVTGDGTTTAFTYAHGLGVKPTRLMGWPERANPITSVTADATNITVTFTTAPANAAVVPVQLRFAA